MNCYDKNLADKSIEQNMSIKIVKMRAIKLKKLRVNNSKAQEIIFHILLITKLASTI